MAPPTLTRTNCMETMAWSYYLDVRHNRREYPAKTTRTLVTPVRPRFSMELDCTPSNTRTISLIWYTMAHLPAPQTNHHLYRISRTTHYPPSTSQNSQPATPTLHPRCIQLELPIPNQIIPPPVPKPLHPTLAQRLHTPPHKWAKPLWHHILHHAPLGQLKQAILQHHPILLVSDASVSACQTSTCTWVIWSTTQLWSGKGIVPSTTNDLYSRLAEAYDIYTVLQFFQTSTSAPFCLYCHIWWL